MNKHLETVLNFIQQSKTLSAAEKNNLSKGVKEADDELKHKNRELEIEASLERVRARTMAMKRSEELQDAAIVLFQQIKALGFVTGSCGFNIWDKDEKAATVWMSSAEGGLQLPFKMPHTESAIYIDVYCAMQNGDDFLVKEVAGEELKKHFDYLLTLPGIGNVMKQLRETGYTFPEKMIYHFAFFSQGYLSFHGHEFSSDAKNVFKRFARVFEQSYTRFLDLEKAEAQAREAKIEAALERVRSRAMAMRKTDELLEAAELIYKELSALGITSMAVSYAFVDEDEQHGSYYGINPVDGKIPSSPFVFPHTETEVMRSLLSSWKKQEPFHVIELDDEATLKHQTYIGEHIQKRMTEKNIGMPFSVEAFLAVSPKRAVIYSFNFIQGYIFIIGAVRLTETQVEMVLRFTKVFEMTYRRFLDLRQAEAQAREAQIEVCLERVRSRTLAMQNSRELVDASVVFFHQLEILGIRSIRTGIATMDEVKETVEVWSTSGMAENFEKKILGVVPVQTHPLFIGIFNSWKSREPYFTYELKGLELEDYYRSMTRYLSYPEQKVYNPREMIYTFFFPEGSLNVVTHDPLSEADCHIMMRFANVFGLVYTRFQDLQKAEAHAQQAQIEEQKLREEKQRSDSLLLNILPEEVANELKQFGKSYARKHEEVTILFADIKGFSSIAENLSADELVTQLDECFRAFDKIIEKHGLEKIKTVGDAYICACGLPKPVPDNAAKTVRAAIDMLDFLKGFSISKKIQNLPAFEFRVGIHTGPVVTGVVGLKKFTYDFWGDTVNMAARMEQHGEAGKINVSGNTYQLIKDKFTCTHRGKIPAKNKGEVDMYFVEPVSQHEQRIL